MGSLYRSNDSSGTVGKQEKRKRRCAMRTAVVETLRCKEVVSLMIQVLGILLTSLRLENWFLGFSLFEGLPWRTLNQSR
jgi:hypothetical protein